MFSDDKNIKRGVEQLNDPYNISFGEFMFRCLKNGGDSVAQVNAYTDETKSYRQVFKESVLLAQCLKAEELNRGDVVSICSENRFEFVLPVLASLYMGYITAPLNFSYTEKELDHSLNISKPKIMFCSESVAKRIFSVARKSNFIKKIIIFGNETFSIPNAVLFSKYIEQMLDYNVDLFLPINLNPKKSIAVILCSSGTTGLPKGVMLSHYNMLVCLEHMQDPRISTFSENSVIVSILPYFHAYGFVMQLVQLAINMKIVILPRFEEHMFLSTIEKYKATHTFLVPPIVLLLSKNAVLNKYDLSSLKEIWCGAASLGKDLVVEMKKKLSTASIRQGYGMTETTLGVLIQPVNSTKYGSVGKVVPGTEAKVIDLKTGKALGANKEGELCFKGPLIMLGYLGDRQATSATLDADGWIHTGDVGYYDDEDNFYIVDRLKELIKYKGYQVPPAELEALLLTSPKIKDAAVIGVPDEEAGELPLAFVVKQPEVDVTAEEVIKFVADNVSRQKRLYGGVKFISSIPKSPSGKILRRELRDLIKQQKAHL